MSDVTDQRAARIAVPPIARGVAFFLVGLLGIHVAVTFLWNAPSNPIREAVNEEVRGYIRPFFQQNWSLFAPNPVNSEDEILVRARLRDPASGDLRTTEWVSATGFEWTEVRGSPAPSRASRLSSNLHRRLNSAWNRLSDAQREIMAADYADMSNWKPLAEDLIEEQGGESSSRVATMVRADRVATGYATQVSRAIWGDEVESVQIQLQRTPVPRWDDRLEPEPEDPRRTYRDFGWRPTLDAEGQDDDAFARTMQRLGAAR
ncbi:hypothetical protein G1H11_18990 [Phytoactinopolyspora alkaliphila]|uniref:Uncharacterized protein n=1 Tax=Phytoactinopolyspora alkaliphila TaxID=1783498 RepID=A0A6N9YR10_9ACTN|nr:hypothetical protein [Phytoactinopolyspora alkaliphila]